MALATEFILRFLRNRPVREVQNVQTKMTTAHFLDKNTKLMLFGLFFSSLTIFIRYRPSHSLVYDNITDCMRRSVYRTIELSDGWDGRIISTQRYFSKSSHRCIGSVLY